MPTHRGSIRLFRLAGIDVYVHWAWFFAFLYFTSRPHAYSNYGWNALEILALFAIVLTHEFGHQLACRSVGGQTHDIILWPLGGVAYVNPPQRPGAQLWSIAAGPLVNVALIPVLFALVSVSLKAFNQKLALDSTAKVVVELKSDKAGYISKCDARIVGEVIRDIGGGRLTKDSKINYDVGVDKIAKPGERVEKSGTLCRVHLADSAQTKTVVARLKTAFEISPKKPKLNPLIVANLR